MDDLEWIEVAFFVTFLAIWGVRRLMNRGRVIDARTVRTLGSYGGFEVALMSTVGGRRYVALNYEMPNDDDSVRDLQILLTSANARRLAEMLEIAASPGRTLMQARVAARRKAVARRQAAAPPAPDQIRP